MEIDDLLKKYSKIREIHTSLFKQYENIKHISDLNKDDFDTSNILKEIEFKIKDCVSIANEIKNELKNIDVADYLIKNLQNSTVKINYCNIDFLNDSDARLYIRNFNIENILYFINKEEISFRVNENQYKIYYLEKHLNKRRVVFFKYNEINIKKFINDFNFKDFLEIEDIKNIKLKINGELNHKNRVENDLNNTNKRIDFLYSLCKDLFLDFN